MNENSQELLVKGSNLKSRRSFPWSVHTIAFVNFRPAASHRVARAQTVEKANETKGFTGSEQKVLNILVQGELNGYRSVFV